MAQPTYWGQLVGLTIGPIVLVLLCGAYAAFATIKMKRAGEDQSAIDKTQTGCMSLALLISYIVFPGSSLAIFRGFACDNGFDLDPMFKGADARDRCKGSYIKDMYGEDRCPMSFLKYDYAIDCNDDPYQDFWFFYCVMFVFIYPLGVSAL